jgi:enoyl-CoA hydratase/carnithine racemase
MKIRLKKEERVAVLTLDNPPANTMDQETMAHLDHAVVSCMEAPEIRVLVLTAAGNRFFAAGAEIRELARFDSASGRETVSHVKTVLDRLRTGPKPVIAAINGLAPGGGLELAMSCDIRVASQEAKFGLPEIKLGVMPAAGGTQFLPRLIGLGRAFELMATGDLVPAQEALSLGLVDRVVPYAILLDEAVELAKRLARQAPLALAAIKQSVNDTLRYPLKEGLLLETERFARLCDTRDKAEGVAAFLERRAPFFEGR